MREDGSFSFFVWRTCPPHRSGKWISG